MCQEVLGECVCVGSHVDFVNDSGGMMCDISGNPYMSCYFYKPNPYGKCSSLDTMNSVTDSQLMAYRCKNQDAIKEARVIDRLSSL